MKRRTFLAGVAGAVTTTVVDAGATPLLELPAAIVSAPAQASTQSAVRRAPAPSFEENALVREILQKALGPRVGELPREQYEFTHRLIEPAIQRALPRTHQYSRFSARTLAAAAAGDPVRDELKEFSGDAFIERVIHSAGIRYVAASNDPPPSTCLVLSGGGAKGSLEVGYLAYLKRLWNQLNITAVCGTSVGAVNAVPIAQAGAAGIDRLVDLWLGLREDSNMYIPHPSLEPARVALSVLGLPLDDISDLLDKDGLEKLAGALSVDLTDEVVAGATGLSGMIGGAVLGGPFGLLFGVAGLIGTGIAAGKTASTVNEVRSKFTLLGTALSAFFAAPGINSFLPLESLILRNLDVSQLGQPGKPRLRLVMVALEDGELYYFTETGTLLKGSANPSKATETFWRNANTPAKVRDAVIASSSPPILFPARPLTQDHGPAGGRRTRHFVDGGVREVLPTRAAVDLGCQRVIGILVSTMQMKRESYPAPPSFFTAAFRCAETMLDEVTQSDTEFIPDASMRRITHPDTDVIDSFTIDPGLIRINIDYGYMRAFDATLDIAGKTLNAGELLAMYLAEEAIVQLRKEIWALERSAAVPVPRGVPPRITLVPVFQPSALARIRQKKRELLQATLNRFTATRKDRDALPIAIAGAAGPMTNIHDWWQTWERHEPGFLADALAANRLWTRLRIGMTGPGNAQDILEGSVPEMPSTREF